MLKKTPMALVTRAYEEWFAALDRSTVPVVKADPLRFFLAGWAAAEEKMLAEQQEEQAASDPTQWPPGFHEKGSLDKAVAAATPEEGSLGGVAVPIRASPSPEEHDTPPVRKSKGAQRRKP